MTLQQPNAVTMSQAERSGVLSDSQSAEARTQTYKHIRNEAIKFWTSNMYKKGNIIHILANHQFKQN